MLQRFLTFAVLLCASGALTGSVRGQQPITDWIEVSPSGEFFKVVMPAKPHVVDPESGIKGKGYEASAEGVSYSVWSLIINTDDPALNVDQYLDATGDAVWDGLLKPLRDRLPEKELPHARMTYVKELPAGQLPGRQYLLALGDRAGRTEFHLARGRVFVLVAMHSQQGPWEDQRFFDSFTVSPAILAPNDVASYGSGIQEKTPDSTDSNRVFSGREVTQKARVLNKAEPTYTESARRFGVQGTVVLRAVFSKDGEVTNIHVVRKLPHGLTQQAINSARGISFSPAQFEGRPVSMWMELQYNFILF